MKLAILLSISILLAFANLTAETVSPLFARGYTVIPEPQQVTLRAVDFRFGPDWRLETGAGVEANSIAVQSFADELQARYQMISSRLAGTNTVVFLEILPGSVMPAQAQDRNTNAIAKQAYRLELHPARIRIVANAAPGLFYGVQTLVQLLKSREGVLWLPEGEIVDWPDLELRQIYWDDAHHLEHLSDLESAVREAAFFKINGFVIKLEGHFEYRSAPAVVEPQALSPAEFQQLTDYGLRYHIQVIPYLDAPAHIAFILKHPEYAKMRAFPESNYEACTTNPDTLKLFYGMFDDLLAANKGVNYFYLSTDEAYYVGLAGNAQCREKTRADELGSVGKVLAEFVNKTATYLHERGRDVVFWGEYPLKPADITSLPKFVINGETYGEKFDPLYKEHGIKQMIYVATEGEERLFPHYFLLPPSRRMHPVYEDFARVGDAISKIASDPARHNSDLLGLITAGWGDMGLQPETFWLGYATITAAGWRPWTAGPNQAMSAFYPLWYGPSVTNMVRVYQLMSLQAQTWSDSWETADSTARKPIWGDSYEIFSPPKPAHDQTISLPPVPNANLSHNSDWRHENAERLRLASEAGIDNDQLLGLLDDNLRLASLHRYDLEIFISVAQLCRQNLDMLNSLARIDSALEEASSHARAGKPAEALLAIDQALDEAQAAKSERNKVLSDAVGTWYKSWLPRVEEAHGRRFLHEFDDVKDHLPDRTVDMSYLVYREIQLPIDDWYRHTEEARNQYAAAHHLPTRSLPLRWKELQ